MSKVASYYKVVRQARWPQEMKRQEDRLVKAIRSFGLTVTNTVTEKDAKQNKEIHHSIKEARTDGQRRQTA